MGRAAPPAAARGNRGYGVVDLTPPSATITATTAAGDQASGKKKDHEIAAAVAAAATGTKIPVPLWKARDILLGAVRSESAGFFEGNSALSSKRRRRREGGGLPDGRGDSTPTTGGAGNGHSDYDDADGGDADGEDIEHVFSVRLEVRCIEILIYVCRGGGSGGW